MFDDSILHPETRCEIDDLTQEHTLAFKLDTLGTLAPNAIVSIR